ncbi:OsmC family protein [Longispora sp. K20-0274]|uniref:OsmC family protein n=1 Tax=Longispora sp. K20-0274 TaxID=3088255 RepID=UPI00399B14F2
MSAKLIDDAVERFTADPDTARSSPSVSASLVDGRARLTTGPYAWEADLPSALGGGNRAPGPTAYLLGALAGCAVAFLHDTLAPQLGLTLDAVRAVATCATDARGLLGMGDVSPDLNDVTIEIHVTSSASGELLARLFDLWQERCPVYLALVRPVSVRATFATQSA